MNEYTGPSTCVARYLRRHQILSRPLLPANLLIALVLLVAIVTQVFGASSVSAQSSQLPNIVLIFTDDLGYADLGTYGAQGFTTPRLDQLASQGIRFTDFHVAESVCTASRVGLLTGSYPVRVGLGGAIGPNSPKGIHPEEWLLSEMLQEAGYATGCFGKWHLGDQHIFLPLQNGFDEFFGLPYSNDMWPYHPKHARFPPLPLVEGNRVIKDNLLASDQNQLTTWYTEKAVDYIHRHHEKPFFLYLAHSMPHVPLGVSDKFRGKTAAGLLGDVIEEIDWSVGEVLDALDEHDLSDNTWVIFTSDNGPWLVYGDHAGSAGPFRDGKHTVFEGGFRVPCVMRWPKKIPAGAVSDVMISTMDLLPTIAGVVDASLPHDRVIDGHDVWPVIAGQALADSPWKAFFYFKQDLHAVRSGQWKLVFPHDGFQVVSVGSGGQPGESDKQAHPQALYDLETDPAESKDVSHQHPEVVRRLTELTQAFQQDLRDNSRQAGEVSEPVSLTSHVTNQVKPLLMHRFEKLPESPWRMPYGTWTTPDNFLRGQEVPAEKHGASLTGFAAFVDADFHYQVRFQDGQRHTLGINATGGHLFHIDFRPHEIRIIKNDLDKDGPERSEVLARASTQVEPGHWSPIHVQIRGPRVTVQMGDVILVAEHPYVGREKGSFNLYVSGGAIDFRDFHILSDDE